ncbi:MAG TPA: 50S ribosomal protein L6 [Balneolaceae bacterium]|nr:50S ribosomal protein L6 [Balneolaceae bacterium]
MSRIGIQPIPLDDGVEFSVDTENIVTIKGDKGSDSLKVDPRITITEEDGQIWVKRNSETKDDRSLHGLYRSLISNMVEGVTNGYKKELEIRGVGYRASINGDTLILNLGFSHPIHFVPPDDVDIEVDTNRDNPTIIVKGINKELVGQVSAKIRSLRPPEPYKGKGIRYVGEWVRRKAGKSVAKA